MADRIVVMRDGEIIQVGTPDEVYDESASVFVASFIGTPPTNFIYADLAPQNGSYHLVGHNMDLALDDEQAASLVEYGKRSYTVGVRPENILLVDEEVAVLSADCLVSEPQGSHQIVVVKVDDKLLKIVAPPRPRVSPGEPVHMAFKPGTEAFFDKETGVRI